MPPAMQGPSWRFSVPLGPVRGGYLGRLPGVYNFGTALNLTRTWFGYSANVRRVLQDFGVTRW